MNQLRTSYIKFGKFCLRKAGDTEATHEAITDTGHLIVNETSIMIIKLGIIMYD
jgi:hypothetical protein